MPTKGYRTEIAIDATAERVWSIMSDIDRWPEWTPSVDHAQRLEDAALTVGSTARLKQPKFPAATWTVTHLEPGRSFTWEARGLGFTTRGIHRIEGEPTGPVRVVLEIELRGALALLMWLPTAGITRRYVDMEARGLKEHAEESRTA
jgi:uncharacterized protein YndB with AHSA1/START domain